MSSLTQNGIENTLFLPGYPVACTVIMGCLDDCATPQLDTVTLRPTPSDTVTIRPTNVLILRQSDPTGVGQSDHTQTAQFDPLEEGLNVGCDNPTHSLLRPVG